MALSSIAMTTVAKAKAHLRLNDSDPQVQANAIDIYHDESVSATAATVEVTDTTIVLIITGGGNAGTDTLTLADAANDTITELVGVINALAKGWVATALYLGDADTGDLVIVAATSAFATSARQTLKIVSNRQLELMIEGVTDEIEKWLDDGIVSRTYSEVYHFDPANGSLSEFSLRHANVTLVTRIALGSVAAMRVQYTGSDERAWVEVTATGVTTISRTGATTTTTASTFASNVSVAAMVTTIAALSGWSATTVLAGPSAFLVREGVRDAKDREITLATWEDYEGDYIVDYEAGIITLDGRGWPYSITNPTAARRVLVDCTAGFASVPDDVDRAVLKAVATEWESAGRDETLQTESLEDYSYSLKSDLDPPWHKTLAGYRRFTP